MKLVIMKSRRNKDKRAKIINLVKEYSSRHFDDELKSFTLDLSETIFSDSQLDTSRGRGEIWAAGISYVIARLNYLFDKDNPLYNSVDDLCLFFKVNKSTVGNKASQIQKILNISVGDKFYTRPEISAMFEFYETEEGFIIPASVIDNDKFKIVKAQATDAEIIEQFFQNRKRIIENKEKKRAAKRAAVNRKIAEKRRKTAEEKRKKREAGQYSLFGDSDNQ